MNEIVLALQPPVQTLPEPLNSLLKLQRRDGRFGLAAVLDCLGVPPNITFLREKINDAGISNFSGNHCSHTYMCAYRRATYMASLYILLLCILLFIHSYRVHLYTHTYLRTYIHSYTHTYPVLTRESKYLCSIRRITVLTVTASMNVCMCT